MKSGKLLKEASTYNLLSIIDMIERDFPNDEYGFMRCTKCKGTDNKSHYHAFIRSYDYEEDTSISLSTGKVTNKLIGFYVYEDAANALEAFIKAYNNALDHVNKKD